MVGAGAAVTEAETVEVVVLDVGADVDVGAGVGAGAGVSVGVDTIGVTPAVLPVSACLVEEEYFANSRAGCNEESRAFFSKLFEG